MSELSKQFLASKNIQIYSTIEREFSIMEYLPNEGYYYFLHELLDEYVLCTQGNSFTVEVKNIDCEFEFLKEGLEQIREEFLVDKDTFIFRNANEAVYNKLQKFKTFMEKAGHNIVITKN